MKKSEVETTMVAGATPGRSGDDAVAQVGANGFGGRPPMHAQGSPEGLPFPLIQLNLPNPVAFVDTGHVSVFQIERSADLAPASM